MVRGSLVIMIIVMMMMIMLVQCIRKDTVTQVRISIKCIMKD